LNRGYNLLGFSIAQNWFINSAKFSIVRAAKEMTKLKSILTLIDIAWII
jgi:hypothetical protein